MIQVLMKEDSLIKTILIILFILFTTQILAQGILVEPGSKAVGLIADLSITESMIFYGGGIGLTFNNYLSAGFTGQNGTKENLTDSNNNYHTTIWSPYIQLTFKENYIPVGIVLEGSISHISAKKKYEINTIAISLFKILRIKKRTLIPHIGFSKSFNQDLKIEYNSFLFGINFGFGEKNMIYIGPGIVLQDDNFSIGIQLSILHIFK